MRNIKELIPSSVDTSIPEDVTQAIHRIGSQSDGDEEIYSWLQSKLRARAEAVLRKFARFSGTVDADQLVNEFMIRLITNIGTEDVQNRSHFFGLACRNFNWIMHDMAGQLSRRRAVPLPDDLTARSFDFDQFISLMDFMKEQLTDEEQKLINMRLILEFRWKSIEKILGIPKATLSDRLKKLVARMEAELSITWEEDDAD